MNTKKNARPRIIARLGNQRGQMAIFIALFFQVLFVFFAMAINVGMVVHDKINLQSSVDLAAYYGAARQGEILNQIAHINYQMRQNFKLFTWRYWGLGSLGQTIHPYNPRNPTPVTQPMPFPPGYCIAHAHWLEMAQIDANITWCRDNETISNIPVLATSPIDVGGFGGLIGIIDTTRSNFTRRCNEGGVMNFHFAARMLAAFRIDGAARKRMIFKLAELLSESSSDFTDLKGGSAEAGARRTLENNLTVANEEGLEEFTFFNSMGAGTCGDRRQWLPEVTVQPRISFVDLSGQSADDGCTKFPKFNSANATDNLPAGGFGPAGFRFPLDPVLVNHWNGEPQNELLKSSLGFEKNPWCMTYVGVQAQTQVRKLFSPLGGTVTLKARAFAKPFGGRIGPWYGRTWPADAPKSSLPPTDPLVPPRLGEAPQAGDNDKVANFSRFVGDTQGMADPTALAGTAQRMRQILSTAAPLEYFHYDHLGELRRLEIHGDSLARDSRQPAQHSFVELAAVAPDAFDITYYSIEPMYFENYFNTNTFGSSPHLTSEERIFDFGSSKDGQNNRSNQANVMNQITNATAVYQPAPTPKYIVNNWRHLLTGWHQAGSEDYTLSQEKFGRCNAIPSAEFPSTGNCVIGGRVGYGVKLVSRDYLLRSDLQLGGPGSGGSQISNPPEF